MDEGMGERPGTIPADSLQDDVIGSDGTAAERGRQSGQRAERHARPAPSAVLGCSLERSPGIFPGMRRDPHSTDALGADPLGAGAPRPRLVSPDEESRDLGFGSVVARESRRRLLNRDGSFNVRRRGLGWLSSLSAYHALLTMSWPRFFALAAVCYLVTNGIFAATYWAFGPDAFASSTAETVGRGYLRAYFFSVETLATIGYGNISPVGLAPHVVMTLESMVGLMWAALLTGLLFARFSRPTASILFSERALIAPYRGRTAFQFRIVNRRRNELLELGVKVVLSRFVAEDGARTRRFFTLGLEREQVTFFPLSWTIVHPIDEASPLWGISREELVASEPEFLVLLSGVDETFSQTVHARSSYRDGEIVWGARFGDVFDRGDGGEQLTVDVHRIHRYEPAELAPGAPLGRRNGADATA
jgi:inward rectifier potassium channel